MTTIHQYSDHFQNSEIDPAKSFMKKEPKPAISAEFKSKIFKFAENADQLANKILPAQASNYVPERNGTNIHHHHHHDYVPYYPIYSAPHSTVVITDRGDRSCSTTSSNRNNRKEEGSLFLAIGAIGVLMGGLYYLGTGVSEYNDTNTQLNHAKKFEEKVKKLSKKNLSSTEKSLINEAKTAAKITKNIHQRIKDSTMNGLYLKAGLATSCGASFLGFWAGSYAAQWCPVLPAVVCIGGLVFKTGLEWSNTDNIRDANALKNSVQKLRLMQRETEAPQPQPQEQPPKYTENQQAG